MNGVPTSELRDEDLYVAMCEQGVLVALVQEPWRFAFEIRTLDPALFEWRAHREIAAVIRRLARHRGRYPHYRRISARFCDSGERTSDSKLLDALGASRLGGLPHGDVAAPQAVNEASVSELVPSPTPVCRARCSTRHPRTAPTSGTHPAPG